MIKTYPTIFCIRLSNVSGDDIIVSVDNINVGLRQEYQTDIANFRLTIDMSD